MRWTKQSPYHPNFQHELPEILKYISKKKQLLPRVVDPWGGSHYVEKLTEEISQKAWKLIQEIEELGGMAKAIETGIPKMRIEEAAARKQARIDSGKDQIIGVNAYQLEKEETIDTLEVDNTQVRDIQIERLKTLRTNRNQKNVKIALNNITE